jgi:hypothetical protein
MSVTRHPILLAQAGRDGLTNYTFILEAPWKACRLCGTVYQSDLDRLAYEYQQNGDDGQAVYFEKLGRTRRENWLITHNKYEHPNFFTELRQLELSGLPYTPEAAQRLSTYGIIYMGEIPREDEIAQALLEAPRAPINDSEG